MVLGLITYQND